MKKIIVTLFLFFLIGINSVYSNSNSIYNGNLETISISAELIDNHVSKLINELESFKEKYKIYSDIKINSNIDELLKMSSGLRKIQNNNVDKQLSSEIIKNIIEKLKKINTELGPYLKQQINTKKDETNKYIEKYSPSLKSFSSKVKNIIKTLAIKIKEKEKLKTKEKRIIIHLKNMDDLAKNLDNLNLIEFNTKDDVKKHIIENINFIKIEITSIKNIIKE